MCEEYESMKNMNILNFDFRDFEDFTFCTI